MNLREAGSAHGFPRLHCLTDQTLLWQRRLRVRFLVNFSFSASMNIPHARRSGTKSLIRPQFIASSKMAKMELKMERSPNGRLGAVATPSPEKYCKDTYFRSKYAKLLGRALL